MLLCCLAVQAQDINESVQAADQYLESRVSSLNRYLRHSQKIQQRLLRKLSRREKKLLRRLAAKDSALYYQHISSKQSFDSIASIAKDSIALEQLSHKKGAVIDKLRGVQNFIQDNQGKISSTSSISPVAEAGASRLEQLNSLQQRLSIQQGIDELIGQRTRNLEQIFGSNLKGFESIQKDVYYTTEKIKVWKKASEDPDQAEEELFEKLQGTPGFENYLNPNKSLYGGLGSNATAADLENMGYQLKSSVTKSITDKLGSNLGTVQEQMATQVSKYSEQLNDITGKVKEAQGYVNDAGQTVTEARQTRDKLTHLEKPSFKKNPERAKPFKDRLEVNYNFQTSRSSTDGLKPAMLDIGASVAFKHTPNLSYGLGASASLGLGQNWQNIKFTYEGVSARAFIDYKIIYGFSLQGGYERIFRPAGRPYLHDPLDQNNNPQPQNTNALKDAFGGQQQAAYIGIMKRYHINSKWGGTFLVGYNLLWQQENMRSPWVLRFGVGN